MRRSKTVIAEHGQEIVRRYDAGESLPQLSEEYGLYVGTLANVIRRLGGTIRTHNPQLKQSRQTVAAHREELVARYLEGESADALGVEFTLGHSTVIRLVREAGGSVRSRGPAERTYGADNPAFKSGSHVNGDGYRLVLVPPAHPMRMASRKGYVLEHRLVMYEMIKRPLLPTETVHHMNGDRLDNRPENLQLRTGQHGNGVHLRCRDCGSQNVGAAEI